MKLLDQVRKIADAVANPGTVAAEPETTTTKHGLLRKQPVVLDDDDEQETEQERRERIQNALRGDKRFSRTLRLDGSIFRS